MILPILSTSSHDFGLSFHKRLHSNGENILDYKYISFLKLADVGFSSNIWDDFFYYITLSSITSPYDSNTYQILDAPIMLHSKGFGVESYYFEIKKKKMMLLLINSKINQYY